MSLSFTFIRLAPLINPSNYINKKKALDDN